MERAKQLREERKNGVSGAHNTSGSVFKNAGADSVHRGASVSRSGVSQMSLGAQDQSTAQSMLSSPSVGNNMLY